MQLPIQILAHSIHNTFEEEWNKMSEKCILKEGIQIVLKAYWYNHWKKNGGHIA